MIGVTNVCGTCGAKISGDVARQVCPACLLESGLGLFDEDAVAGVVDPGGHDGIRAANKRKAPRSAKILSDFGDYELLEEIGRGGQGVVYRAHQKSLNRTVALKVIGFGPWTTETHLRRFRREAEAAASLEHPRIVPIYEVGEADGSCYFSMKFVEGGQLDEVVGHLPMSIKQAVELVTKVARTVHYAHEHGILHRDIKPGNILLDQSGEPHLTDFGLARLVEAGSTVTATLDVLGTPSYMAPEQACPQRYNVAGATGETTKVSKATDVYGLGAVLYQLLTGQPPFAGGTTYETIKLLLETEPRQPRQLNPQIDRDLSTICLKCLEKDPKRRYSSALALTKDLEHWVKHEPIQARHTGIFTRGKKWLRRNPTSTLLAVSLLALAAIVGWMTWKTEFVPPPLTSGVAVLPFENLSGNPDNVYFADGIQEEILTRLASIAALKVISRTSTKQYQSKPRNLREIAKELGVANIVEGSVRKAAEQVRVNVQLINAQTDSHLWADTYDRKLTDMFGVESEIAKRIAESLQAKLSRREEQALAVKPTNNPEAYDAYLRGLAFEGRSYFTSYSSNVAWEVTGFYERAVQLDPNFATAWARLSHQNALIYLNRYDAATAARGDAAKRALEQVQKLEPDSSEALLALGYYQYDVLGDNAAARTTFEHVQKLLPGSSEVLIALATLARGEGHWDQSVAQLEEALTLDPRNVQLLMRGVLTYANLRQFSAALKLCDRVLDITPNDPDVMATKASIYQAEGNLQEAARLLSGINEKTANGTTFGRKLNQLQYERNYDEAIRLLQARLAQTHYDARILKAGDQVTLAFLQHLAGNTAESKATAEQARNTLEQSCTEEPNNAGRSAGLSQVYALIGEKDLALRAAQHAVMLRPRGKDPLSGPNMEENLAAIQTICAENNRAISTLIRLLQTPYAGSLYYPAPITPALLRIDPMWDPLRTDPAFQKLCEEKK